MVKDTTPEVSSSVILVAGKRAGIMLCYFRLPTTLFISGQIARVCATLHIIAESSWIDEAALVVKMIGECRKKKALQLSAGFPPTRKTTNFKFFCELDPTLPFFFAGTQLQLNPRFPPSFLPARSPLLLYISLAPSLSAQQRSRLLFIE
jgi:hypothetical protein